MPSNMKDDYFSIIGFFSYLLFQMSQEFIDHVIALLTIYSAKSVVYGIAFKKHFSWVSWNLSRQVKYFLKN